jgi:hypothetical protein
VMEVVTLFLVVKMVDKGHGPVAKVVLDGSSEYKWHRTVLLLSCILLS